MKFGRLLIMFDDAQADIYDGVAYAAGKGIVGTIYAISDEIDTGGNLTTVQLQAIDGWGWAIGNHTQTSTLLDTLSEAEQEATLSGCKTVLDGKGLAFASSHVAYPGGAYNADTLTAMAAVNMLTGRTVGNDYIEPKVSPIYEMECIGGTIILSTTLKTVQDNIFKGISNGKWAAILFHGLSDTPAAGDWPNDRFRDLIDWMVAWHLKPATIVELYSES